MTDKTKKDRITITLSKQLLPKLDNFIDGEKIRNRSHAIEYILSQHLGLGIQKAVILASADSEGIVHALTTVRHRPVIEYLFDMLKVHGIRDIVMVMGEGCGPLKDFVGDGSQWKMRVVYIEDTQSTGTASALQLAKSYISETFLLIYSDTLYDINLSDFVAHHQQTEAVGTVALTHKKSHEDYGVARMEGSRIVEYEEKPGQDSKHGLVNAGLYLFEPEIFDDIDSGETSLEKSVLPHVAKSGKLAGYPFQGKWFDISKESHRDNAEAEW